MASNAITTFSFGMPNSLAISSIAGSFDFSAVNLSFTCNALYAVSLKERLTRIGLLSLKYLLTSPIIIGTA